MKKNKKDRKRTFKIVASLMLTVLVLTGSTFAWFTSVTNVNNNYYNIDTYEGYINSSVSSYEIIGEASLEVLRLSSAGERRIDASLVPMVPIDSYSSWRSGTFNMKKQNTSITLYDTVDVDGNYYGWDTSWDTDSVPGDTVDLFTDSSVLHWSNSAEVLGSNGTFKFYITDESDYDQFSGFIVKDGRMYAEGETIPEGNFDVYVFLDGSTDNSSVAGNSISFKINYEAVDYQTS